jgi:hypothetical protein
MQKDQWPVHRKVRYRGLVRPGDEVLPQPPGSGDEITPAAIAPEQSRGKTAKSVPERARLAVGSAGVTQSWWLKCEASFLNPGAHLALPSQQKWRAAVVDDKKYDEARDLSEKALDAFVEGDEDKAAKLVEQAKATNPQAVKDVAQELDEDAGSEHDPAKINEELGAKR